MTISLGLLEDLLPPDCLITDPDLVASFAHDEAEGAPWELPRAVVRPRETADVVTLVRFCAEHGVPIVPRGAGTGLSGGANATVGSIVVSFDRMDRIVRIDSEERLAVVQPGVINADLRRAAAEHGLWYPPDPSSHEISTLGGNVATNAGGLACVKYGVTRDYVLGLEAVVGRGEPVWLGRRTAKGVAGYDLAGLFVGSEGTLGVITEITLRLRGARRLEHTVVGYFGDLPDAGRAAAAIWSAGLEPSALELIDRYCLRAVDDWKRMGLADEGDVLLLARTDAPGDLGEQEADSLLDCFRSAGATWSARSTDETEAEALFEARRLVYHALERKGRVFTEDVCVPRMLVTEMLQRIEGIAREHDVRIPTIAHLGDGNLHPMLVLEDGDEEVRERGQRALERIVDASLELGGTVTGEHGVGLLKRRGLEKELEPAVLEMHRAVKKALDPAGIFNPTKVLG